MIACQVFLCYTFYTVTQMAKGKYARKQQRAQQEAEKRKQRMVIAEQEKASQEDANPTTKAENKPQNNENPPWYDRFAGWVRKESTFTDWCIAVFTLVLAAASIFQFIIIGNQLDVMRKDQRAWLEFQKQPDTPGGEMTTLQITTGQPVTYPLRVTNIGKTPARNIVVKIFVDIVDSSQNPPLDHVEAVQAVEVGSPYAVGRIRAGIVFPNTSLKQVVVRPMNGSSAPMVATDDEVSAIKYGRAYLAVYGIITYDDVFNTHHWTTFCDWESLGGTFNAAQCAKYNNVDGN